MAVTPTAPQTPGTPATPAGAPPSLKGEWGNISVLLLLYFLQGLPMGLAASIPLYLKATVDEAAIANFVLCSMPYSLKLLWSPIVDAVYIPSIGRRKSWVIPVQLLVGVAMIFLSANIDAMLQAEPPAVGTLTMSFFVLYLLVATQDIAVDGWALTMLRPENVSYASTCNVIGQTAGWLASYASFLAFTSPEFCNRFRTTPSDTGFVTMAGLLHLWGVAFLVITLVIAQFKTEASTLTTSSSSSAMSPTPVATPTDEEHAVEKATAAGATDGEAPSTIRGAYAELLRVFSLRNVMPLSVILLTSRLAFMTESALQFEMMDKNVQKEDMFILGAPLVPVDILLSAGMSRFFAGPRPMRFYMLGFVGRLVGLVAFNVLFTIYPDTDSEEPGSLLMWFLVISLLYRVPCQAMFGSQMAFFARVADPALGGSYMTFLNTLANLGYLWTAQVGLRGIALVDDTFGYIRGGDGFTIMTWGAAVMGVVWMVVFWPIVSQLERAKQREWKGESGARWLPARLQAWVDSI